MIGPGPIGPKLMLGPGPIGPKLIHVSAYFRMVVHQE